MLDTKYKWIQKKGDYIIQTPIGNQTLEVGLQNIIINNTKTIYYNIYIAVFHKRKQIIENETGYKITGKSPFATASLILKILNMLEQQALEDHNKHYNITFYCKAIDNRRKNVYNYFLSQRGYSKQYIDNRIEKKEVIAKTFKIGEGI